MPFSPYRILLDEDLPRDIMNGYPDVLKELYLSDLPQKEFIHTFVETRCQQDFVRMIIKLGVPEFIFFGDYPSGDYTALKCAKWLSYWCKNKNNHIPRYVVHTHNEYIKKQLERGLEHYRDVMYDILPQEIPPHKDPMTKKKFRLGGGFFSRFDDTIEDDEDYILDRIEQESDNL